MSALPPKADIPTLLRKMLVNALGGTKSENSACKGAPGQTGVTGEEASKRSVLQERGVNQRRDIDFSSRV